VPDVTAFTVAAALRGEPILHLSPAGAARLDAFAPNEVGDVFVRCGLDPMAAERVVDPGQRQPLVYRDAGTLVDAAFLHMAYEQAMKSPDPSTQQGAVLVTSEGHVIGRGHNHLATGTWDCPERLNDRNLKYPLITHAERDAIYNAINLGNGDAIAGAILYAPWAACERCAEVILELHVGRVVSHRNHPGINGKHPNWIELCKLGLQMLNEASVRVDYYDGELGCEPIRFNYGPWRP
jgi:dCMP deaminase